MHRVWEASSTRPAELLDHHHFAAFCTVAPATLREPPRWTARPEAGPCASRTRRPPRVLGDAGSRNGGSWVGFRVPVFSRGRVMGQGRGGMARVSCPESLP
jgi:hypothetical protein